MMISNLSCISQIVLMVSNLDTRETPLKRHKTGYENVNKEESNKLCRFEQIVTNICSCSSILHRSTDKRSILSVMYRCSVAQ